MCPTLIVILLVIEKGDENNNYYAKSICAFNLALLLKDHIHGNGRIMSS